LSTYELRTSIAVSDIEQAVASYEDKLGLPLVQTGQGCLGQLDNVAPD
jgi:catechol 2,3-dioxygenase-like lactoylglutathione lyase family enzyme